MDENKKLDAEWIALNAFRGLAKIASHGDMEKSTYDAALDLGGELYPELLGSDVSILKSERESDTTKEYRQKARLKSIKANSPVTPLSLIVADIEEHEELLEIAKQEKGKKQRVDLLQRKLGMLNKARKELEPKSHSENQLIFRDAYNVERTLKALTSGQGYRDFELPNSNVLRVRVLHPDNPEHITGSDIIYERHSSDDKVSIVAVQYKIWDDKKLYLSDQRMIDQIGKMKIFLCDNEICKSKGGGSDYRFPCCSAFLRPTDKLQRVDQKFLSKGEHIPICKIDECASEGPRGGKLLEYKNMRDVALSNEAFEFLFNKGKIGSDWMSQDDLHKLYSGAFVDAGSDRVVIYAQEFIP